MILGVGIDLLNIKRIEKLYLKFDDKLANRILSREEFSNYKISKDKINFLAKKFCAKEAFSKALGTGIGRGINFLDITISNDILGKPIILLSDNAISSIELLLKRNIKNLQFNISMTDEDIYVNSFVIVSYNE